MNITLIDFARKYDAFETLISVEALSVFIEAYDKGFISKDGFRKCLELWFSTLKGVGIFNGKPMGLWETTI